MTDFEIVSFEIIKHEDDVPYVVLAVADVTIPQIGTKINGVRLTWAIDRGYKAAAPRAAIKTGVAAVQWRADAPFVRALCEQMQALYRAMGGVEPSPSAANDNQSEDEGNEFREGLAAILKEALK